MSTTPDPIVDVLDADECWELLSGVDFGRLAIATDPGVDIFPMNFLVRDRAIYLRSAPGTKLMELTEHPSIAFEADGTHDRRRWSVVVKGEIRRLGFDSEIIESGVLDLWSKNPTEKWNYLQITPSQVTGRRFTSQRRSS